MQIRKKEYKFITIPEQKTRHIKMRPVKIALAANRSSWDLLPRDVQQTLSMLRDAAIHDPKKGFTGALQLEHAFPGNSAILSFIAHIAIRLRKVALHKRYVLKNFEKNPHSLLARISYANQLLLDRKTREAYDLFHGYKDLKEFASERPYFFLDEYTSFLQFLGNAAVDCGNVSEAEEYHYLLYHLDMESDGTKALGARIAKKLQRGSIIRRLATFFRIR